MNAPTPRNDDDVAQVRRMVARVRRMLGEISHGISRSDLRRKLNSREKHLYDDAIGLLLAVGDIEAVSAYRRPGGVIYRLCQSPGVAPRRDSETTSPKARENASANGRGESTSEPREVAGDPTECAS